MSVPRSIVACTIAAASTGCASYRTVTIDPADLHVQAARLMDNKPGDAVDVAVMVADNNGAVNGYRKVHADDVVRYNGEPFVIRDLVQDCVNDQSDRCWLVRNKNAMLVLERSKLEGGHPVLLGTATTLVLGGLIAIPVSTLDSMERYPRVQTGLQVWGGAAATVVGGLVAWFIVDCFILDHNCRD